MFLAEHWYTGSGCLLGLADLLFLDRNQKVELGLEFMNLVDLLRVVLLEPLVLLFLELLKLLELRVQLIMPGVEHRYLEHQRARPHNETGDRQES